MERSRSAASRRPGPDLIRRRTTLLGLLAATLVMAGASSVAVGHANYLRSDPAPNARLDAPPARIKVGFSEKVAIASSGLSLLDQTGKELGAGGTLASETELTLPFPPGAASRATTYTVAWHTVSAEDGDAAKGYFSFFVGPVPPLEGATSTRTATQGNVVAALGIRPLRAGENDYTVALTNGGDPMANVSRVRLRVTPLDRDIGQSEIVLQIGAKASAGRGLELPFPGRYRIQVQVRRSDSVDDLAFDFEVQAEAPNTPAPTASASAAVARPSVTATPVPAVEPMVSTGALVLGALLTVLAVVAAITLARRSA